MDFKIIRIFAHIIQTENKTNEPLDTTPDRGENLFLFFKYIVCMWRMHYRQPRKSQYYYNHDDPHKMVESQKRWIILQSNEINMTKNILKNVVLKIRVFFNGLISLIPNDCNLSNIDILFIRHVYLYHFLNVFKQVLCIYKVKRHLSLKIISTYDICMY